MTDLEAFVREGDLTCVLSDRGAASPLACNWGWRSGPRACAGPARTVRATAGSLVPIVAGIDALQAGEVLVIDARDFDGAVVGGRLAYRAAGRHAAGIVVLGRVRDVDVLRTAPVTVVALGVAPHRSDDRGAGAQGEPTRVGDVTVAPGDVIVVDGNGVVVVRFDAVHDVIASLPTWLEGERVADAAAGVPGTDKPHPSTVHGQGGPSHAE